MGVVYNTQFTQWETPLCSNILHKKLCNQYMSKYEDHLDHSKEKGAVVYCDQRSQHMINQCQGNMTILIQVVNAPLLFLLCHRLTFIV